MLPIRVLLLLLPMLCAAAEHQLWQEGELLSRKTVIAGRRNPHTAYVYRIKAGSREYIARFEQPLTLSLYAPLQFSVAGRHLLVRYADGSEQRAALLQKTETTLPR